MNMRKIIAVLAAVLMLCAAIPMGVFAAPGDVIISKNFDDGSYFSNGSNENGYMVFDATKGDWYNVYLYANAIKSGTKYEITFDAKADKATNLNVKINNNWSGDTFKWTTSVTTEWATYTCVINPDELATLTSTALLMFTSNTTAANGAIYHIDNVVVTEYKDPATIGKVVNGDFSTTDGWKLGTGATIENGVLNLTNPSTWGEAALQSVPAKANTEYEITWKSQRISGTGAFNLFVMDASNANLTKVAGQNWMNETSGNWVNNTYTINTGASEVIKVKFSTEASNPGTIYIDDFKITEVKDPSFDGYIYNGDFETGKLGFGTGQVSTTGAWYNLWGSTTHELVAGYNGDYALKGTASGAYNITYQNVAVEPNTDYTVWAYSKDSSNANLWIKNAGGNGDITNKAFNTGSDWALTSVTFNSGSNTSVWVGLMGIAAGATYTVDDIFMFEAKDASNDGYLVNGDFETGSVSPWENLWGSCPTVEIIKGGKDDTFALNLVSGEWKHFRQTDIAVEPNTEYKISLWSKNVKNMSLLVKDGGDTANIINKGISNSDDWALTEVTFNSGSNSTILVSLMGGAAEAYGQFDNIVMVKNHVCNVVETERVEPTCGEAGYVKYACECGEGAYTETLDATGEHVYDNDFDVDCNVCGDIREVEMPVQGGGCSVRESEDGIIGLAAKFDITVDGMAIAEGKYTQADYTNATMGGYKLISMGVIASNYKSSVEIEAKYLCELGEGAAAFAARIINIPEDKMDEEITFQSYFVVEIDGVATTIYGGVQTQSYNGALGA